MKLSSRCSRATSDFNVIISKESCFSVGEQNGTDLLWFDTKGTEKNRPRKNSVSCTLNNQGIAQGKSIGALEIFIKV